MDKKRYGKPCKVFLSQSRILKTAGKLCREYRGDRIGILNFASAFSPGGAVIRGGQAQEECLCRCSTLYPCLNTEELQQDYFDVNRKKGCGLCQDACIYTPGVICIKEDTQWPELMEYSDWFPVDVISCALHGVWNTAVAGTDLPDKGKVVSDECEGETLLVKQIRGMLYAAAGNQTDILVIGVPGYGKMRRLPEYILKKALKEYRYSFKAIVFAEYCPVKESL